MKSKVACFLCLVAASAKIPTVCSYGKYVTDPFVDNECLDCPEGKYRDTVQWDVRCKECPLGQVSGEGSIACQNLTLSAEEEKAEAEATSTVAAGGVGVAAGATIGVAYYASST